MQMEMEMEMKMEIEMEMQMEVEMERNLVGERGREGEWKRFWQVWSAETTTAAQTASSTNI